jgi:hypothetical protein
MLSTSPDWLSSVAVEDTSSGSPKESFGQYSSYGAEGNYYYGIINKYL